MLCNQTKKPSRIKLSKQNVYATDAKLYIAKVYYMYNEPCFLPLAVCWKKILLIKPSVIPRKASKTAPKHVWKHITVLLKP